MTYRHVCWDLDSLENNSLIREKDYGIPLKCKNTSYPIRMLRYWFCAHFLREECRLKSRPLSVLEVGIDRGQMKGFADSVRSSYDIAVHEWDGVDCVYDESTLRGCGYSDFFHLNIESGDLDFNKKYDVIILLHVLEHLSDPESIFTKLANNLREGGVMIGGFPVLPHPFVNAREKRLRKIAKPFGHISVFSPRRLSSMAVENDLVLEFSSGAFLMRRKGFALENYSWWIRFNLIFGASFPALGSELYWKMRKP